MLVSLVTHKMTKNSKNIVFLFFRFFKKFAEKCDTSDTEYKNIIVTPIFCDTGATQRSPKASQNTD